MRIFDLHCDTLDTLAHHDVDLFAQMPVAPGDDIARNQLALSLDRMRATADWCQCYAVWVPDALPAQVPSQLQFYRDVRDFFRQQMEAHADEVTQLRDARDVDAVLATGKVAVLLTVEGASPVGDDLGVVDEWADDGVKMVTLTWNGKNSIASGHDTQDGFSSFGREAVRALEDRKIVVDVSHLNDVGFWELMDFARRPVAVSHSNSRALCSHLRNLTDDMFRAVRDGGGIVGLNYFRGFVSERCVSCGWEVPADGEVSPDELFAHLDRWLDLDGADVIALGSDFDGCECPAWLDSCEKLGGLERMAVERYGQELADKLFFGNARAFFVRNETA